MDEVVMVCFPVPRLRLNMGLTFAMSLRGQAGAVPHGACGSTEGDEEVKAMKKSTPTAGRRSSPRREAAGPRQAGQGAPPAIRA
ncbi:hypothetical protein QJS66_17625 [Kocuria rhizophila]|nr:hypothetical protein QJS66_17625 [Kocuria rhizophila]